ncbi:hypothetical protein R3P38DRAFT_2780602 [Favolaschia claudopus]|uniref:GATA-type domain-containing protein n=1 Tax=Favolaschia claudopus TaxID=2862362 RepID=A0AAW0BAP2_9AGAR
MDDASRLTDNPSLSAMSNHLLLPSMQTWNYPLDIADNTASTTIFDPNLSLAFDHSSQQATDMHDFQLVVDRFEAPNTSGSSNMNAGEQNANIGFSFDLLRPQPNAFGPLSTEVTPAHFNEWMNPLYAHPIPGMLTKETDIPIVGAEMAGQPFNEVTQDRGHTFGSLASPKKVPLPLSDNHTQHDLSARFMRMIFEANVDPYEFISSMLADRHLDEDRLRKVFDRSHYSSRRDGVDRGPANRRRQAVSRLNRKCFECGGMETKQWRRHPESKVYLCNPCGQKAYRARFSEIRLPKLQCMLQSPEKWKTDFSRIIRLSVAIDLENIVKFSTDPDERTCSGCWRRLQSEILIRDTKLKPRSQQPRRTRVPAFMSCLMYLEEGFFVPSERQPVWWQKPRGY